MKKDRVVGVDANWLLWRAYSGLRKQIKDPESSWWHHPLSFTVCKWAAQYALDFSSPYLVICIDGPNNFRRRLYSEYKGNRNGKRTASSEGMEPGPEFSPYAALPMFIERMNQWGLPWEMRKGYEADDLLISLSLWAHKNKRECVLVTNDKDSVQGLHENTILYRPQYGTVPERSVTVSNVIEHYGMNPNQYLAYQVLAGDIGDYVPGILKPAAAKAVVTSDAFVNQCGSDLRSWLSDTEQGRELAKNQRAEISRNWRLVRMAPFLFRDKAPNLNIAPKELPKRTPEPVRELHGMVFSKNRRLF